MKTLDVNLTSRQNTRSPALLIASMMLVTVLNSCQPPPPYVIGTVEDKTQIDTAIVTYDIEAHSGYAFFIDEVTLSLHLTDSSTVNRTLYERTVGDSVSSPMNIVGSTHIPLFGASLSNDYSISINGETDYWSKNSFTQEYVFEDNRSPRIGYEIVLGAGKLQTSHLAKPFSDINELVSFRYRLGALLNYKSFEFGLSTSGLGMRDSISVVGSSKRLRTSYSEYLALRSQYFLSRTTGWKPSLTTKLYYSQLLFDNGTELVRKRRAGVGLGVAVENRFDEFKYTYNTSHAGFHELEASFSFVPIRKGLVGASYSIAFGSQVRTYSLGLNIKIRGESNKLEPRSESRSFLMNTVAAGFFAPVYWLFELAKL